MFGFSIIHILYTGCAKIRKITPLFKILNVSHGSPLQIKVYRASYNINHETKPFFSLGEGGCERCNSIDWNQLAYCGSVEGFL